MSASTPLLRVFLLGDLRLEWDGHAIELPRRERVLRLWVRLALQPGRPLPRQPLAFALWPDVSEADALANLRRHLYLLRSSLPEPAQGWLAVSTREVIWAPGPNGWSDLEAFEAAAEVPATLDAAAALYRGDLARELSEDDVILARREQVRQRHAAILKTLATRALDDGAHARGLVWARALLGQDPWDEESVRLKMTLEALSGNRQAAVATYEALAASLATELQTTPLPETMALYADLVHNRVRAAARREDASSPGTFVGRQRELRQIQAAVADVARGQGATLFISGDAGSGKTALVREALHARSEGERKPVFWGACHPTAEAEAAQPYGPWQQILTLAAPIIAHRSDFPAELLNVLLPVAPDLGLLRPGLLAPSQPDAAELRRALRQVMLQLAKPDPLVLVLEDLHWADRQSLDLLDDLAAAGPTSGLLVLATHRSEPAVERLSALKRDLRRRRRAVDLVLEPFTADETLALLERALDPTRLDAALVAELTAFAQGSPLLLREALESLIDAWGSATTVRSPLGLREALRSRLDRLPAEARAALEAAAILGPAFLQTELERVLAWPTGRLEAALDLLLARRLLSSAGPGEPHDYAFSHQLTHDVLAAAIDGERAGRLHLDAAGALSDLYGDERGQAGRIARHLESGGQPVRALPYWMRRAEALVDLAAFDEARVLLDGVLDRPQGIGRAEREIQAQAAILRATLAHYEGRTGPALALIEAALPAAREFPTLACKALTLKAFILSTRDDWATGLASALEAVAIAQTCGDLAREAEGRNLCGICRMMLGETRAAVVDLDQARVQLEATGQIRTVLYAQTLNHLGTALVFTREYSRAVDVLERTATQTRAAGLRRLESASLTMLGQIALNRGRYADSIGLYTRAIEVVGQSYRPGLWAKFAGRGSAYLRRGDTNAAIGDFQRGLELTTQLGTRYGQALFQTYQVAAYLARRDGARPGLTLRAIERTFADIQPVVIATATLQGEMWRLLGDLEASRAALARASLAAEQTQVPSFMLATRVQALQTSMLGAEPGDHTPELEAAIAEADCVGEVPVLIRALFARAVQAQRDGCDAAADADADRALILARTCADQALIVEALVLQASSRAVDPTRALPLLHQARVMSDADCWPWSIAVRRLEARLAGIPNFAGDTPLAAELRALLGDDGSPYEHT